MEMTALKKAHDEVSTTMAPRPGRKRVFVSKPPRRPVNDSETIKETMVRYSKTITYLAK
jgi:hypothetical protein